MTVDKRTPRSRLFKDFLRQPPRPQPSFCDDIPQPIFDFTNGDPALHDLWELLRSVFVSASTMQSPLAPTIRYALLKLDQAAINTTSAMMEMLKFQLPPFTSMPKSIPVSPVEPSISPDISSASLSFADDDVHLLQIIAQLDDLSATLSSVEPKWHEWGHSLTAQVDSVSSIYEQRFSSQFAALNAELVRLHEDNTKLTAETFRLHPAAVVSASPTVLSALLQDTLVPTKLFDSPVCSPLKPEPTTITFTDKVWTEWDHHGNKLRSWRMTSDEWDRIAQRRLDLQRLDLKGQGGGLLRQDLRPSSVSSGVIRF